MSVTTTVSLVGVGGQGILLAAAILAESAAAEGLDVKASEVKGMAQRGGSVLSTVRFGSKVWSPVARHADLVVATEALEGRRALAMLTPRGTLVCAVPGLVQSTAVTLPAPLRVQVAFAVVMLAMPASIGLGTIVMIGAVV